MVSGQYQSEKSKKGQSVESGLKEEIREECNLKLKRFKELKAKNFVYSRAGHKVAVRLYLFEILNYSGMMKNRESAKHSSQVFLPLARIKRLPYLSDSTVLYLSVMGFKRKARFS